MSLRDTEAILLATPPISVFAVIVLYKTAPKDSVSFQTLVAAFTKLSPVGTRLKVLLYDNTPSTHPPVGLPNFVLYVPSPVNTGLATAYNLAVEQAAAEDFTWLLTLDQDTTLPDTFLEQLVPIAQELQQSSRVAAIVPHISSGSRTVSPNWFIAHVKPRWFPYGFNGIPAKAVYALNSGALIRVAAIEEIGGYSKLFWLDAADLYLFRRLERAGKQVMVAGAISIQHDLSLTDIGAKMSLSRYQNALAAGSAFSDLELGPVANIGHTLQLLYIYLRQRLDKQNAFVHRLTYALIRARIFQSKRSRLRLWLATEQKRMDGWHSKHKTGSSLGQGTVSLLAVVVLHQMAPEDSLTLRTLRSAAAHVPSTSIRYKIILFDNTPGNYPPPTDELNMVYIAADRNVGLSEAYNHAIKLAKAEHFDWILTLDQDTDLPADFLEKISAIAEQVTPDEQIAAILPILKEGDRILSPHWFKWDFFPKAFSASSHGVQVESVYAFNSGSVLRTRALEIVGGYNPLFWLDYSDAYIFRMLHRAGYKAFVAGEIVIQHQLSLLKPGEMSAARYRNIVQAGSAFCDLYRGPLVGLEFTYRLVRSYLGQLRSSGVSEKKQILASAIRSRLFQSRNKRIQDWTRQDQGRRDRAESPQL